MNNKNSVFCTINGVIGFIAGISYAFTLILLPIAIYCFIGAKKYIDCAGLTDSELAMHKKSLVNWAVFFSIFAFPIGLLSIIPALKADNNVSVTDIKIETTKVNPAPKTDEVKQETQKPKEEAKSDLSASDTIEKLKKFLEDGLITEEEFNRAKSEILGEKEE